MISAKSDRQSFIVQAQLFFLSEINREGIQQFFRLIATSNENFSHALTRS
jgi:hypothetical protein